MMQHFQALACYWEDQWAAQINQAWGFHIRIGTQTEAEQQKPSRRRPDRLNADNRRQAAHRLTEPAASTTITSKGGGGGNKGLFASNYGPVQGGGP